MEGSSTPCSWKCWSIKAVFTIQRTKITPSILVDLILSYGLSAIVGSLLWCSWKYADASLRIIPHGISASDAARAIGIAMGFLYIYSQIPAYILQIFPWMLVLFLGIKLKSETLLYYMLAGALVTFMVNIYVWTFVPDQPFAPGLPPPFWSSIVNAIRYQTFLFLTMGASFGVTTFCVLALCQKIRLHSSRWVLSRNSLHRS